MKKPLRPELINKFVCALLVTSEYFAFCKEDLKALVSRDIGDKYLKDRNTKIKSSTIKRYHNEVKVAHAVIDDLYERMQTVSSQFEHSPEYAEKADLIIEKLTSAIEEASKLLENNEKTTTPKN